MTASSETAVAVWTTTVWPAERPATLTTLTFVSPAAEAAARVVAPGERRMIELLFSRTVFATLTLPTSQPARVKGTHGAGALRAAPVPPSDGGSPLTMLQFESADGVGG